MKNASILLDDLQLIYLNLIIFFIFFYYLKLKNVDKI